MSRLTRKQKRAIQARLDAAVHRETADAVRERRSVHPDLEVVRVDPFDAYYGAMARQMFGDLLDIDRERAAARRLRVKQ